MSIQIIKPGILTTIQDQGRTGYQRLGVPVSGCMDRDAAAVANVLCGNAPGQAVLETTLHGLQIFFGEGHLICLGGAGAEVLVNECSLPFYRAVYVPPQSLMVLRPASMGCRTYLAVAGGIAVEGVMGSGSTHAASGAGKPLVAGDLMKVGSRSAYSNAMWNALASASIAVGRWGTRFLPSDPAQAEMRIIRGPEWEHFTAASHASLLETEYHIGSRSDRMGYRLEGEILSLGQPMEIISTAVNMGVVQVVPDGMPLLLMADAQTTGGYPRIAQVILADLGACAQQRPGSRIRFKEVDLEYATTLYHEKQDKISDLQKQITIAFSI